MSEGHLQNLPLVASYGCLATENPRHTSQNSIAADNLESILYALLRIECTVTAGSILLRKQEIKWSRKTNIQMNI